MYRIRFHGRGGQGIKTAGRILGNAFFHEGFQVQDAPRYGAERRGAPIFAYVRASRDVIHERGIIRHPDLVVVADDSLVPVPAAGILEGISRRTVLLVYSHDTDATWQARLSTSAKILVLPPPKKPTEVPEQGSVGAACVGAAARLIGVISADALRRAIEDELADAGPVVVRENVHYALDAYEYVGEHQGLVKEGGEPSARDYERPAWISLPFEDARVSAPAIYAAATSVEVRTGLWRTLRPVIDYARCNRCWWVCGSFCPDSAIDLGDQGYPQIDYDHCKGCMICVAQCPPHAISAIPETDAEQEQPAEIEP